MHDSSDSVAGQDGLRRARVLIGWMTPGEAGLLLNGRRAAGRLDEAQTQRFEAAQRAVSERPEGIDQQGVVQPLSGGLDDYLERFWATEHAKPFLREGWEVKCVDLRKLCAFQPSVFLDHAERRVGDASAAGLEDLVRTTLPLEADSVPSVQFDHEQRAWVISSDNPNLDVIGHFSRPLTGGKGCGFLVAIQPSCMQVIRFKDRYLLKDGYHRALGFLQRGVYSVPALCLDVPGEVDFNPGTGVLPKAAWLGPRPPLLPDYLSDGVSLEVALPSARRMVVVQAMTLNPAV